MQEHAFSLFGPRIHAGILQSDATGKLPFAAQRMRQVHGTHIEEVLAYGDEPEADALVTRIPGMRLMVKTADCIPLVLADEEAGVIAAVHAGWRGLTADMIPRVLERLAERGAKLERLKVGIGPSLGKECAAFSDPLNEIPEKYHWAVEGQLVDLNAIALQQLVNAGIFEKNIEWKKVCTACDPAWFSWRRDQTLQRLGTWIELV